MQSTNYEQSDKVGGRAEPTTPVTPKSKLVLSFASMTRFSSTSFPVDTSLVIILWRVDICSASFSLRKKIKISRKGYMFDPTKCFSVKEREKLAKMRFLPDLPQGLLTTLNRTDKKRQTVASHITCPNRALLNFDKSAPTNCKLFSVLQFTIVTV
jgi:hypothetical protein